MAASRPGVAVARSDLATMFWGDRGDEQARASLRQSLGELRDLANGDEPALVIDQTSVMFIPDRVVTWTAQLDEIARNGEVSELQALLAKGDDFLAGLDGISASFDEWLRTERGQALDALVAAGVQAAKVAIERGDVGHAQRLINRLQAIDPLDERMARAGFDADAAAGDAAALERRLRSLEQRLIEELGVAPSQATLGAYAKASAKLRSVSATQSSRSAPRTAFLARFSKLRLTAATILVSLVVAALVALLTNLGPSATSANPRTIAVIPFVAAEDQKALAEGVAEEIVSRLSRNPRVAPLGRNSARIIAGDPSGAIALGRELRVDYLLNGKLNAAGNHLSIGADLIRTRDGQSVWSETYTGTTGELVALMNRIGSDVSRKLGAGALPQPQQRSPRKGADQLYYRAKALLRGAEPQHVSSAVELLRQAVRLDPEYAPAWSLLGMAARTEQLQHLVPEGDPDDVLIPQAYARRGLELAPDSAEANLAMGDTLAEDPRSVPYVLRAAQLDPTDAEIWFELSEKLEKAGDFVRLKQALDRAAAVDPLWPKTVFNAAYFNWSIGERGAAMRQVQQLYRHGLPRPHIQHMVRANRFFQQGDFSRAYQEFAAASASTDPASRIWADGARGFLLYAMGMPEEARSYMPFKATQADWELFMGRSPSAAAVEISRKHAFYAWNIQERNYFLLRLLVNERRFAEVAGLYDGRFRSPEEFSRTPRGHIAFIDDAIPVIIALRQMGRAREADRIYAIAHSQVEARLRAGKVPDQYQFLAAQIYALGGDQSRALELLGRASNLGWLNRTNLSLPDIADEPAFRSFRNYPGFQQLRNRMEAHYARERAEILSLHNRASPGT